MSSLDLKPDIRELDNGETGYFYSITQLEAMRDKRMKLMSVEEVYVSFGLTRKVNVVNGRKVKQ